MKWQMDRNSQKWKHWRGEDLSTNNRRDIAVGCTPGTRTRDRHMAGREHFQMDRSYFTETTMLLQMCGKKLIGRNNITT